MPKKFPRPHFWLAALPFFIAPNPPAQAQTTETRPVRPAPGGQVLRGEASFRERIALLPGATLHVLVVKDLPGESGIPVGSTVIPARNGSTPFAVPIPASSAAMGGPYRVRAWIIAGGRVFMRSLAANTGIEKLDQPLRIQLGMAGANGQTGTGGIVAPAVQKVISGKVSKLDRRGLAPDASVTVQLREMSDSGAILQTVATQEIPLQGKQLPVEYRLEVPANILRPGHSFALVTWINEGGKMPYLGDHYYKVDTGVIQQEINLTVVPPNKYNSLDMGHGPVF